jgi:hypothetical protein
LDFPAAVTNPLQGDLILNSDLSGLKPSWKEPIIAIFVTIWKISKGEKDLRYLQCLLELYPKLMGFLQQIEKPGNRSPQLTIFTAAPIVAGGRRLPFFEF